VRVFSLSNLLQHIVRCILCSWREESVRNTSGESLPLYKIKSGPFEGKIEEKKNHCVKRDKSEIWKASDSDWILER